VVACGGCPHRPKESCMEGAINPLAVRDPWRCSACGTEWLVYEMEEPGPPTCPRCDSADVAPFRR
jgi:hypothetical protein